MDCPASLPLRAAISLALVLTFSPQAWSARLAAGDASAAADSGIHERKTDKLDTVRVVGEREPHYTAGRSRTASKTGTPLIDTPQSITVITQQLIRDQAMQGMADVVRYVPGVGMAQGEGNRDTPIFRGSGSTADLFIDGMRDDVQYFRDLYNIERVEVLKGPNAMIFGRGGSGGLLNRVTRQADGRTIRDLSLQAGSWGRLRATTDLAGAIGDVAAFRINVLVEEADSFRDDVSTSRRAINPTLAFDIGDNTRLHLGVEHFEDQRTADRGVSSLSGRPLDVDPSTFFGDPGRSPSEIQVDTFSALFEHAFANGINLRNRTLAGRYDKFYQNIFPGVARADQTVLLSAYNNATTRDSVLNQTDLSFVADIGATQHTLLAGAEFGRQETDNFRETGYFSSDCPTGTPLPATSVRVSIVEPRYTGPICFQQSASDADNHSVARTAAVYLQDQIQLTPHWLAVVGLRFDRFEVELRNNRTGAELSATDELVSPRVGLVYKPQANISFYANYSRAFLPRSGEQLASLSASNAALQPEAFKNLEVGAKWDIQPRLSATIAVYRLTRSNVAVVDPLNPADLDLLPGDSQRVQGVELGISGKITEKWSLIGGIAYQDAIITQRIESSAGNVIAAGTELAQVPRRTFSLWSRYDFNPRWGAGLGMVARDKVYSTTSNLVTLPGYGRVDAAIFFKLSESVRMQLNVENLLDKRYFATAHNDTNISPGSPRAINVGLNLSF
ncbi:MAG: TonB-dependent siderophore receptor [Frankiaceae bacterium]|nr:TonB-dependent siderophore receptor [Arenimonas sp.]